MQLHTVVDNRREIRRAHSEASANPATRSLHAMALASTLGVAARVGLFGELAEGPAEIAELARRLTVQADPLRMMLDVLCCEGLVEYCHPCYGLSPVGRRWLDPDSPTGITTHLSHTLDEWTWWGNLEGVLRGQQVQPPVPSADDEAGWLRKTRADYEMARLCADDVAIAMDLPSSARSVLDLGGGDGWYAAALCKRNSLLKATVIDTAGAVLIGREIMWETDMDSVVRHEVGTLADTDLGGPHDAALCLPLMYGMSETSTAILLRRIRNALRPGAVLAIPRVRAASAEAEADESHSLSTAALALFTRLKSGVAQSTPDQLDALLVAADFAPPIVHGLPANPEVDLYVARAI